MMIELTKEEAQQIMNALVETPCGKAIAILMGKNKPAETQPPIEQTVNGKDLDRVD